MTLLDVEDKLMHASDILEFLAGVETRAGTIMGENGDHGHYLILRQVISTIDACREAVERNSIKSNQKVAPEGGATTIQ